MNNGESPVICDMIDDIRIYGLLQKHCYIMSPKERERAVGKICLHQTTQSQSNQHHRLGKCANGSFGNQQIWQLANLPI